VPQGRAQDPPAVEREGGDEVEDEQRDVDLAQPGDDAVHLRGKLGTVPRSCATPPRTHSVIPSIWTPSRRARIACPSSCRKSETKNRIAAASAIAM